jgi:hypothetical protein
MGVENKKKRITNPIKKKIAEVEVQKESVKQTDIDSILDNMQSYEQSLLEMDPSCGGPGFELTAV